MNMKHLLWILVLSFYSSGYIYSKGRVNNKKPINIIVATWNLGHFSGGKIPDTQIKGLDVYVKGKELCNIVNDSLNADIICLNEYNVVFGEDIEGKKHFTKDIAFNKYSIKFATSSKVSDAEQKNESNN